VTSASFLGFNVHVDELSTVRVIFLRSVRPSLRRSLSVNPDST
jgi:hypothetical protein